MTRNARLGTQIHTLSHPRNTLFLRFSLPPSLFFLLLLLRCLGLVRRCALSIPSLPPSSPWIAACLQFAVFVSG